MAERIAEPGCPERLARNVEELRCGPAVLARSGSLTAYVAEAERIPEVLTEIGRLREVTFREVGEGTGRRLDLDRFDAHYSHLFVWDEERRCVVGAYRCARTETVLATRGREGLYSSSLFDYSPRFFERLGPAVELGRSFVRPEYQRVSRALILLWRGIAGLIARDPRAYVLFGPVSISASYSRLSRELIVQSLSTHRAHATLHGEVAPRIAVRPGPLAHRLVREIGAEEELAQALSDRIEEIEGEGARLPVLVEEYMRMGGRFAAFNRDPDFSDVIDGLVVVDLRTTPSRLLSYYMGREESGRFLERHAAGVPTECPATDAPRRRVSRAA